MPTGIKPWKKWIYVILEQEPWCNIKEMSSFLGAVNTYQLMWPKQAYCLQHSKRTFVGLQIWTKHLKSWKLSWLQISSWCTLITTYHSIFILMLLTTKNLGAIIIQQKRLIEYWSHKLTETQQNYHTTEKNSSPLSWYLKNSAPCSLVLCFSDTDHKNLTFATHNSCCILSW